MRFGVHIRTKTICGFMLGSILYYTKACDAHRCWALYRKTGLVNTLSALTPNTITATVVDDTLPSSSSRSSQSLSSSHPSTLRYPQNDMFWWGGEGGCLAIPLSRSSLLQMVNENTYDYMLYHKCWSVYIGRWPRVWLFLQWNVGYLWVTWSASFSVYFTNEQRSWLWRLKTLYYISGRQLKRPCWQCGGISIHCIPTV